MPTQRYSKCSSPRRLGAVRLRSGHASAAAVRLHAGSASAPCMVRVAVERGMTDTASWLGSANSWMACNDRSREQAGNEHVASLSASTSIPRRLQARSLWRMRSRPSFTAAHRSHHLRSPRDFSQARRRACGAAGALRYWRDRDSRAWTLNGAPRCRHRVGYSGPASPTRSDSASTHSSAISNRMHPVPKPRPAAGSTWSSDRGRMPWLS